MSHFINALNLSNAVIAIIETIRETLPEKPFQELGLETLKSKPWFRNLSLFHKLFHSKSPGYLYQKITTHMLHEVLLTIKFLLI